MPHEEARAIMDHAMRAFQSDRPREAAALLDEAEAGFATEGNDVMVAVAGLYRAQASLHGGDARVASSAALTASRRFAILGLEAQEACARAVAARALERNGRVRAARLQAGRALVLGKRAGSLDASWRAYHVLADLATTPRGARLHLEAAIHTVEQLGPHSGSGEALLAPRRETIALYEDRARVELAPPDPDPERAFDLVQDLKGRILDEALRGLRSRPYPAEAATAVSPASVQMALGSDEALVEYAFLGEELHAFVVRPRGLAWVPMRARREGVMRAAGRWRSGAEPAALEEIASLVWRPLAAALSGARSVVVAPAGPLHAVPFPALPEGEACVIARRDTTLAASGRCLLRSRRPRAHASGPPLVLGVSHPDLPTIDAEIEAVANALPGARVLVGRDATREALARWAPDAEIVHVAAHRHRSRDAPLFSSIELGDGALALYDLCQMGLRSRLVVLSGREHANEDVTEGDERMGLARGLHRGGVGAVVTSRWPVDEVATVRFMEGFYGSMARGEGVGRAFSGTLRAGCERGESPRVWAAFTLEGEA